MFYRKDHGYIFVHNPKTAGRSIRSMLNYDKPQLQCPVSHVPLYAIDDHEDYYSFGFVRNPWDRLVSYYMYLCQRKDKGQDNYDREEVKRIGFNKWLTKSRMLLFGDDHPDVCIDNTIRLPSFQMRSQMWWLEVCDFIGQYENLQEDLKQAAYWGGFKLPVSMPLLNMSLHKNYTEYYNQSSINYVKVYCEEEIDRFGYRFQH